MKSEMNIDILDEFAVQTCYLGRYGQEIGSDQFGATIMINQGKNFTNGTQNAFVRLSNVQVNCLLTRFV